MQYVEELTSIPITRDETDRPRQATLKLTDESLSNYTFVFMSDAGTVEFDDEEVTRSYPETF